MAKKLGIQTKGTGRAALQGGGIPPIAGAGGMAPVGGAARRDMRSGYYPSDMGMRGGPMYNKGGRVGLRDRAFAKGGKVGKKSQGYKAREDESLGMRTGKESTKKQSFKDRRDESYGKWGKRKAGRVNKATGGRIGLKHGGSKKAWKKHDDSKAEAAHEMAKRGKKQKTFFSDTGKSHGKGHRIRDTKSVSEKNRKAWKQSKK